MKELVLDIETDSLTPSVIHLCAVRDIAEGETKSFFLKDDISEFLEVMESADIIVGHNILGFDSPVLKDFIPGYSEAISEACVIDTLVCSRLFQPERPGGHSLAAWGETLGYPKISFNDFSKFTPEMEAYCHQDVKITTEIYLLMKKYIWDPQWKQALSLEHSCAEICREMHDNGFAFDIHTAKEMSREINDRLEKLDELIRQELKPKPILVKEFTPVATKYGTISKVGFKWYDGSDFSPFEAGAPMSVITWEEFNPASPKQIVERLHEAGWEPVAKTKGHIKTERQLRRCRDPLERQKLEEKLAYYSVYGWSVSEENLQTLPEDAPEGIRRLAERITLASRGSTLAEWLTAVREDTGRIHGNFNHIGSWTGRMSHSSPNMANIPGNPPVTTENISLADSVKHQYNIPMRRLWGVSKGNYLVGVDAEGIQLRVLAHLMDDSTFTTALVEGDKSLGTDVHSLNRMALGKDICQSRDDAKTFIYAWLLGASAGKVAEILSCSLKEAKQACENFLDMYPGLKELKEVIIPRDADNGYFIGVDKRVVPCNNEHLMLAGYLQNGEAVIMKYANRLWKERLIKEKIPFKQVNFVHDEWQTETESYQLAKYIAEVQCWSIKQAGVDLSIRCPLAGSTLNSHGAEAIGKNWSETH